ncbi:MAG: DUF456 domain-containing protein [Candidatus Kerfeldbacteria bacterium]|nr:DUF456 domain-containing protein [Candidatus Kerfeldbacteria bacterium]
MEQPLYFAFALLIMLAGMVGIFLPFIPSMPLIWLGVFFYGLVTDFTVIDNSFLVFASLLVLATIFLDYLTALWGGKRFRASLWTIFGAIVGGLVGSLFGLFYALIAGPILGAVVAEVVRGHDAAFTYRAKRYQVVGFLGGTIVKVAVGIAIVGLFLYETLR